MSALLDDKLVTNDARTLADAVRRDLRDAGICEEGAEIVEGLLSAPLHEAGDRALARYREFVPAYRERIADALIRALLATRTYEGWRVLMAGRREGAQRLDVRVELGFAERPLINYADREIGFRVRIERQDMTIWVPFAAAFAQAQSAFAQLTADELNHLSDRVGVAA